MNLAFHGLTTVILAGGAGMGASILAAIALGLALRTSRAAQTGITALGLGRAGIGLIVSAACFGAIALAGQEASTETREWLDELWPAWLPIVLVAPSIVGWWSARGKRTGSGDGAEAVE